jgi:hypothetical protein
MRVNETKVRNNDAMTLAWGDRNTRTKSYHTPTLSTINPTQTDPTQNSGLGGDRPATTRQGHGTVMRIARSSIKIVDMTYMLLQTAAGATDFGDRNIEKNSVQIITYAHCKGLSL